MAFAATDGQKYTNLPPMKAHQRSLDTKKMNPLSNPGGRDTGNGSEEDMNGDTPENIVAQHGPATEVHVTHDHEGGKHHVHSVHKDGFESHSDHASPEEAHAHATALSSGTGMGDENPQDQGEWE